MNNLDIIKQLLSYDETSNITVKIRAKDSESPSKILNGDYKFELVENEIIKQNQLMLSSPLVDMSLQSAIKDLLNDRILIEFVEEK